MIAATQLRVGMTILFNGEPYRVVSVQHITPGNWRGMVQTKLKHLKTGSSVENRFRSEDKLEKAHLEQHEMEYLYNDGDDYHFMNSENYEQVSLSKEILGDNTFYLIPNIKFMVEYYNGAPVGVDPPKVVELKVVDTAPFMKSATVTASQKPATLETGLVVNVPGFIESGEVIRVDTTEARYLERAKAAQ
ncbi:MAG: elongation factor P [Deltaproteobacteria bacterium]|nr:elongation factor P [Deltaproteobacteria bacterium]MCL4873690.1 elongation factor P [bacterium]